MIKFTDILENMEKPKIYCDMDGVLCDLGKLMMQITNGEDVKEWQKRTKKNIWFIVKYNYDKHLFSKLDWKPGGKELWKFIEPYNPTLLSAHMRGGFKNDSIKGKQEWIEKNIPSAKYILVDRKDKSKYASGGNILIDDYESNCAEWEQNGGIAIMYKNSKDAIKKLKEILDIKNESTYIGKMKKKDKKVLDKSKLMYGREIQTNS